jgi:hypothetical protein
MALVKTMTKSKGKPVTRAKAQLPQEQRVNRGRGREHRPPTTALLPIGAEVTAEPRTIRAAAHNDLADRYGVVGALHAPAPSPTPARSRKAGHQHGPACRRLTCAFTRQTFELVLLADHTECTISYAGYRPEPVRFTRGEGNRFTNLDDVWLWFPHRGPEPTGIGVVWRHPPPATGYPPHAAVTRFPLERQGDDDGVRFSPGQLVVDVTDDGAD